MKKLLSWVLILFCYVIGGVHSAHALTINNQHCVSNEILVKFKRGTAEHHQTRMLNEIGALKHTYSYNKRFLVVTIPDGMVQPVLQALATNPLVEYVTPNYFLELYSTPDDPLYKYQWNFSLINVEPAWNISTGDGVTVAVVDTGVNPTGRDGFGNRLLRGYDAILGIQNFWQDANDHGTHVAGTIAQETNNGVGVAGIAFNAKILPVKVLPRKGSSLIALNWVVDGINWAADHGADIINLSLGGANPAQPLEDAINNSVNKGVTIIAAAGNDGGPVGYPAAYDNVIAVGAVDSTKQRTAYSNYGPEVDLVAPGGDGNQDANNDGKPDGVLQETFQRYLGFKFFAVGWGYYFFSGTSMAAPHVSGVAALVKSLHPDWTPQQIRDALINTSEDLGPVGKDDMYGYGLVNALGAVTY
jgi:serine protease